MWEAQRVTSKFAVWSCVASELRTSAQKWTYFLYFVFFFQFLGQQISEELIPDLNQISENSDPTELGRLLQLILGCAVNCERKQGTHYLLNEQQTAPGDC